MVSPRFTRFAGQVVRFGISTGFSAALSFGFPLLLHEYLGVSELVAVAIGFATAYAGNILLLRNFVFRSTGNWRGEVVRYVIWNGVARLLEYATFYLLFRSLDFDYRVALLLVLGVSTVLKFFLYRWVFAAQQGSAPVS
jgi:putative flippase GtrA